MAVHLRQVGSTLDAVTSTVTSATGDSTLGNLNFVVTAVQVLSNEGPSPHPAGETFRFSVYASNDSGRRTGATGRLLSGRLWFDGTGVGGGGDFVHGVSDGFDE